MLWSLWEFFRPVLEKNSGMPNSQIRQSNNQIIKLKKKISDKPLFLVFIHLIFLIDFFFLILYKKQQYEYEE